MSSFQMTTINTTNGDSQRSAMSDANGHKPEDDRKLFVGGLPWDTAPEDLREYFSSFGHILDCSIKHDPATGRSRGFAFLVFDRKDVVDKILSQSEHVIKGRKVDPKPAHRRSHVTNNNNNYMNMNNNNVSTSSTSSNSTLNNNNNNNRKVFIGGLDPNFSDTQLKEYFSQFGPIDEIDLPFDKEKNERRPFCFISFQNEQSAQEVLRLQKHTIGDKTVDVKRAKPKTSNYQQQQQQQQMYDPYIQQSIYGNYGTGVPSYGLNPYPPVDVYANWNNYSYNQAGNAGSYAYGGSDVGAVSNSAPMSYPSYSQAQSNSQYPYGASNAANPNEYYPSYGYPAPQAASNVYVDPNAYGGAYDYNSYYPSGGANINRSIVDNGTGQPGSNSPNDTNNYDHDNHYGKSKASMMSNSNFHAYPTN